MDRSSDSSSDDAERAEITPPALPRRKREDDHDDSDEVWERPKPARHRRKRRPASNSNQRLLLLIRGIGALLLVVLGLGAAAIYYFGFFGATGLSAEEQLIGIWETDPEPWNEVAAQNAFGVMLMPDFKFTFNRDHTYKLSMLVDWEGRWQVIERTGNRLRVKLVGKVFGIEQSDPPTATITVIDKDHIYFDSNEHSLQLQMQFRRVGSGSSKNQGVATKPADKGVAGEIGDLIPKSTRTKYVPRLSEKKLEDFLKGRTDEEVRSITDTQVYAIMGEPTRREPPFTVQRNGQTITIYKAFWEVPGSGIHSQIGFMNGKIGGMILGLETPR